jgi:membrane protease YdiL (CAAX protease family)
MFSQVTPISDKTPMWSLLRIALTLIIGLLAGVFVATSFIAFVYGDVVSFSNPEGLDPSMAEPLLLAQGMSAFISFILFPLIHIYWLEHKSLMPLFGNRGNLTQAILFVVLIGLAFPLAISPLAEWNANFKFPTFMAGFEKWARYNEDLTAQMTNIVTSFDTVSSLLTGLLIMAVLAAIGEELVFRGMIQNELWRGSGNIHIAIWATAFIFSAIHIQFFGFIPRLLLGALFGYLYYWSGNLLVPMAGHFVNNAFAVVMRYLYNIKVISTDVESPESAPWSLVIVGIIVAGALIYQVRNLYLNSMFSASNKSY